MRFGVKENQFVEGRHLSPITGEGGLKPILCFQTAKSVGEGFVSGTVAMQVVGFSSCVTRFFFTDGVIRYCFRSNLCS